MNHRTNHSGPNTRPGISTDPVTPASGYVFVTTSTFFAACATVTGKWNLVEISALLMSALIFTIATVALSVGYIPFRGLRAMFTQTRRGWFWMWMFTLSSFLAVWFFWEGVQRMDPSLAAFLNRSEVMIAIILGMIFLKERFNRIETAGAILSIAGIVIMRLTLRMEYSTGFWLVLAGSLFFGITEFFSKVAVRHVSPVPLVYLRNMFMAVVYWIFFFGGDGDFGGLEKVWPGVLALGFFGPIFSRLSYLSALKRMELAKVAIISQGQPVFVILISLLWLHQLPTVREVTGGIFLTVGCLVMILGRHQWNSPWFSRWLTRKKAH